MKEKIPRALKKLLEKQKYAFIGDHSAIKTCEWTRKSLRDEDVCYKEKFYGIKSHLCCQISPSIGFCQNRCVFCWRPVEYTVDSKIKGKIDDPKELIENAIKMQQRQLIGFQGYKKVNRKKLKEAMHPNQFAISLSGEPTLYPKLGQLIKEINKRKATSFLVTNGLQPEVLEKLKPLPTNLYISLDAPNEELLKKIDKSVIKNAWQKLNKSLKIMGKLKTTTVIRITLIKGLNDIEPENYAKLIQKAKPNFVEVKAFMFVGGSRERLELKNMPYHKDILKFAKELAKLTKYKIKDQKKESRVVLLVKD